METVSDLKRLGASLYLSCGACRSNKVTLDPNEAFDRYGPFLLLKDIARVTKCSKCGAKGPTWIKVDFGMPG
jgi:hypothetical protein